MANIQAFRGLRYDLARVGSLSSVTAPPYDVIDSDLQESLYQRNDHNVVRLILNRGDDLLDGQSIYERAAEHLKDWRRDGLLKTDNVGSVYVYHQTFNHEGQEYVRRGFMCRVRLEPFGEGTIYPHEETHASAKEDRFKLMSACQANLSPIFGIFPDEENEVQTVLENAREDSTPLQATDENGVEHQLWLVTDADAIAAAAQTMGHKSVYIADGHHRYETACNIKDSIQNERAVADDHPSNYVMMMMVSMHDPGMAVLPTHRLFRDISPISSTDFISRLGENFECEVVGAGPELAQHVWELIALEDEQTTMGFYCRADDQWVLARLAANGLESMEQIASEHSDEWRGLGVALLHRLVIEHLLSKHITSGTGVGTAVSAPKYVHSIEEVVEGLKLGDSSGRDATGQSGSGQPFELACLVMPATVDHVKAISENGERMPAKSTYFYPKLLSGLVINPLDE